MVARSDSGGASAYRDGIKSVVKEGVPPESEWPYSENLSVVISKPNSQAYTDALLGFLGVK